MRHDIHINGITFSLRPVELEDASFILMLRTDPKLNKFLHPTSETLDDQIAWMLDYFKNAGQYYFVVEDKESGNREGVISIYNVDSSSRSAEWGRWILMRQSTAAIESAMLIYRCAFEVLNLQLLYCKTAVENEAVVSFHDSCGLQNRVVLDGEFDIAGERMDAIEHRLNSSEWEPIDIRLEKLARMAAKRRHV